MADKKIKNNLSTKWNWLKNIVALIIGCFYFAPFFILLNISFKPRMERTSHWMPSHNPTFDAFRSAFEQGHIGIAIKNTLIITVVSVVLIVMIGSIASYPLARRNTRVNKTILSLVVGVMMVPPLSVLVPIYKEMVTLKGVNTYWGIIALSITYNLPMAIFMFTNFISAIPKSLDEAALIDGCSQFMIFPRIILPNMMPVVSSVLILTGVGIWNDYSFQLYMLQKPKLKTITLAMNTFFGESTNLSAAAAAAVLAVIPVIVIYLCLQKYFIKGTMDSAIK